jgi:hypothetical protein
MRSDLGGQCRCDAAITRAADAASDVAPVHRPAR